MVVVNESMEINIYLMFQSYHTTVLQWGTSPVTPAGETHSQGGSNGTLGFFLKSEIQLE